MYGGANRIPLEGRQFGHWLVESYAGDYRYNCICVCGKAKTLLGNSLTKGDSRSCGCQKYVKEERVKPVEPDRTKYE